LLKRFRKSKLNLEPEWPPLNIPAQIEAIRQVEAKGDPGLGRCYHHFEFHEFDLRLDRDITNTYRLIVNQGRDRRYSFSIYCQPGDYTSLQKAFEEIIHFLEGDRRFADIPRRQDLKGHFFR
jgi:hypothetical protein